MHHWAIDLLPQCWPQHRGWTDLRRELVACHGPGAPWILGLAVSVGRTFPVIKRAMGHARACSVVTIGGTRVAPAAR